MDEPMEVQGDVVLMSQPDTIYIVLWKVPWGWLTGGIADTKEGAIQVITKPNDATRVMVIRVKMPL